MYPCSLRILRALYALEGLNERDQAARRLAVAGFFFMTRPGELVRTTKTDKGRSSPFRLKDIAFGSSDGRLWNVHPTDNTLLNDVSGATQVSLTYTDQKNCVKGETVSHAPSGDPKLCPVRALEEQASLLLRKGCDINTPLHTYFNRTGRRLAVTATHVTLLLRRAAALVKTETGIPPEKISMRSLRPGGATALLCSGETPSNIALVGRWRSEAILRYLRAQVTPTAKLFAQRMVEGGNFTFLHNTTESEEALQFPCVPDNLPEELKDTVDLTDDASIVEIEE